MSDDYKRRQGELIAERAKAADVVITTALIPGRPAPRLISAATVESMKPGSVIVDMAAAAGGNCELTEAERTVVKHGVHLVGITNLPGLVAADASALYARNVLTFLNLLVDSKTGELNLNREDEIIAGTLVCVGGEAIKKQ
jgi:NAD(P) transhydrogenase subunit alpha